MARIQFDDLPDSARLWFFPASRSLEPAELTKLNTVVEESLAAWNAHGSPVTWGYKVIYDQFLVVGVDETKTALSGCSIDSCVHQIQKLEPQLETSFLDNSRVFYRQADRLHVTDRPGFRSLAESGAVTGDTVVFNNIIPSMAEFRRGQWEVEAKSSWHARAFPLGV
ncbi:MAG: ABC transporter ATPase [Candidatus Eisenbacteria bacterium]|uniref:ABC transporter ATPase n=1 Tax=Eiseniibacteriota bacterium TaxID=2212470 RepID=A0A7Y2EBU2_UNCEI|nr:ABC transporter ATPase [Candidatus Eisenbacteria bacterium]